VGVLMYSLQPGIPPGMRITSSAALVAAVATMLAVAPTTVAAQAPEASGPTLALDEAIEIARRNNPAYLQAESDLSPAGMRVRSAYAAFLPSVNTSFDASYREGRQQFFGGTSFGATSDVLSSGYSLDATLQLNSNTYSPPRQA